MKDTEYKYFRALSDVLLNSITRKNHTIIETLSRFFYGAFKKVRDDSKDEPVVYPTAYYEMVYRIIEVFASQPQFSNPPIEYRTAGSIWLLGEMTETEISENTYNWIWRNLSLAIKYEQDEMIMYHWQTAHQYMTYSLRYIQPEFDFRSDELIPKNEKQIEKRKSLRKRFIEFHYALGGLLLYRQRFKVIKRIFDYTTSTPPRYELLPESMNEVFYAYNEMRDPFDRKHTFIGHVYPFPDLSGLNADSVIKKWISSYMALLFLRQYTIYPYLITMRPLDYPNIPKTQGEIKQLSESLTFFKTLVSQHLGNRQLMEATSLDFITKEWCETKQVPYPLDFIDSFKVQLENAYDINSKNLPISPEKKAKFINATKSIVESAIKSHDVIKNPIDFDSEVDKWYVNGQRMIQTKDSFSENPEIDHLNFDTILGYATAEDVHEKFASTFVYKTNKTFILKPEDIFKAIDILGIDSQYIIIGFGINLDHYVKQLRVSALGGNYYRGINVVIFKGSRFTDSSFFIVKITDLPSIKTLPIGEPVISTYSLEKISDSQNLYASVVDLSKASPELFTELKNEKSEEELKKSVLVTIGLSLEIRWRKEMRMIQLTEYSEYRQSGLPNTLSDVKQFINVKG